MKKYPPPMTAEECANLVAASSDSPMEGQRLMNAVGQARADLWLRTLPMMRAAASLLNYHDVCGMKSSHGDRLREEINNIYSSYDNDDI